MADRLSTNSAFPSPTTDSTANATRSLSGKPLMAFFAIQERIRNRNDKHGVSDLHQKNQPLQEERLVGCGESYCAVAGIRIQKLLSYPPNPSQRSSLNCSMARSKDSSNSFRPLDNPRSQKHDQSTFIVALVFTAEHLPDQRQVTEERHFVDLHTLLGLQQATDDPVWPFSNIIVVTTVWEPTRGNEIEPLPVVPAPTANRSNPGKSGSV